jgi:hypothetical protein
MITFFEIKVNLLKEADRRRKPEGKQRFPAKSP